MFLQVLVCDGPSGCGGSGRDSQQHDKTKREMLRFAKNDRRTHRSFPPPLLPGRYQENRNRPFRSQSGQEKWPERQHVLAMIVAKSGTVVTERGQQPDGQTSQGQANRLHANGNPIAHPLYYLAAARQPIRTDASLPAKGLTGFPSE
jgi:hypothetical protein